METNNSTVSKYTLMIPDSRFITLYPVYENQSNKEKDFTYLNYLHIYSKVNENSSNFEILLPGNENYHYCTTKEMKIGELFGFVFREENYVELYEIVKVRKLLDNEKDAKKRLVFWPSWKEGDYKITIQSISPGYPFIYLSDLFGKFIHRFGLSFITTDDLFYRFEIEKLPFECNFYESDYNKIISNNFDSSSEEEVETEEEEAEEEEVDEEEVDEEVDEEEEAAEEEEEVEVEEEEEAAEEEEEAEEEEAEVEEEEEEEANEEEEDEVEEEDLSLQYKNMNNDPFLFWFNEETKTFTKFKGHPFDDRLKLLLLVNYNNEIETKRNGCIMNFSFSDLLRFFVNTVLAFLCFSEFLGILYFFNNPYVVSSLSSSIANFLLNNSKLNLLYPLHYSTQTLLF